MRSLTLFVWLAFASPSGALSSGIARPWRPLRPAFTPPAAHATAADDGAQPAEMSAVPPPVPAAATSSELGHASGTGWRARARQWAEKQTKMAAALGIDFTFAYGLVSNVNMGLTVAAAWFVFCRTTALSPLSPGQWNKYLATYGTIYATFGFALRPARIALGVGCTPYFAKMIQALQRRLPFYSSRPRLNRGIALWSFAIIGNTAFTAAVIVLAVRLASILTRVPIFPPDWVLFGRGPGA